MKKIVPDPPHLTLIQTSSLPADLIPPDALAVANDLLLSIHQALNDYCHTHPTAPALNKLRNAAHSANTASALITHALTGM
ncbi:hypothetical protein [Pseudomonas cremoricolorata]|uniref:Uncharacterized protein n=1 Tax=Pseudomonas cremoricolorata TaxID=157783 RepID=A0A089WPV0_9PSED|nr:hypothetical protein [Pseudomonas cremoricolorata]AIR88527.1 hypothetical protein LK03_04340 [Pseudomonas cremoricolorata]